MGNAGIILWQLVTMLIFVAVGFALSKAGLLTKEGSRGLQNVLLYVILPCVIINSFNKPRTADATAGLLYSIGLGALALGLSMALSWVVFRKDPESNLCSSFSNAGFMGVPLVSAVLGSGAVFYLAGMIAMLNALQWIYGQLIMTGERKGALRGVVSNPLLISFFLGLICYAAGGLPGFLSSPVSAIAACNAPIAMFILGVFLSRIELRRGLVKACHWANSAMRLLVVPLATLGVFALFPSVPFEIRMALLIAAAAPAGSNAAIYAQRFGRDYQKATVEVFLSTVLSLFAMPLVVMLAEKLWTQI